jgi:hypothetical protein
MSESGRNIDFDMQAAWLRRFKADAESNLKAFALRLKEAMPELVTIHESRGLFRAAKVTGVTVELGESRYMLEIAGGHLDASIAMVVRGITLSTKRIDPAAWFARLAAETQAASEHAKALSQSLSGFMAS